MNLEKQCFLILDLVSAVLIYSLSSPLEWAISAATSLLLAVGGVFCFPLVYVAVIGVYLVALYKELADPSFFTLPFLSLLFLLAVIVNVYYFLHSPKALLDDVVEYVRYRLRLLLMPGDLAIPFEGNNEDIDNIELVV